MSECYAAMCQHHSIHYDSDEGPFCWKNKCVVNSADHPIFFFANKRNEKTYVGIQVLKKRSGSGEIAYFANGEKICEVIDGIPAFMLHGAKLMYSEFLPNSALDVEEYADTVLTHHGLKIVEESA